jgi:hypothetical protein
MIILPQQQSIGEILGQGLADVAGHWAQHRTTSKALKDLGFSDAQAKAYANLSPQIQQQAVHAKQQQEAQQASTAAINQILGAGLPQSQQQQFQQPQYQSRQAQMQGMQAPAQSQEAAIQQATSIAQNPSFRKLNEQQQQAQALQNQQQLTGQANPQRPQQLSGEQQAILQSQSQQAHKPTYEDKIAQINRQRQALGAMPLSPNDRFRAEALLNSAEDRTLKEEQHRQKQEDKRGERVEKRENTLRRELEGISKKAERAEQDIHSLQQIKAANDTGTLIQGPKRKLLEKFDLQDYFTNTTTQYVAKNIERMVTGAGQAFGTGRLTNFLAEAYAKGLPRLVNTKEGMDLIVKNVTLEKKADVALNNEVRAIKREYREKDAPLPFDIEDQARERIQPKLDQYARESLKNIEEALGGNASTSFESLPKASDYTGKTITDTKTGIKYKSNGSNWVRGK